MKITIQRKTLNKFRRECREAFPKEHFAALHGTRGVDEITITDIVPIPHEATDDSVNYTPHQLRRSKIKALKAEADWIGTIHSHPDLPESPCCEHPSPSDIRSALEDGETVMAIVYLKRKGAGLSSHVGWFIPKVPPKIELL